MVRKTALILAFSASLAGMSQGKWANVVIDVEDGKGYAPCEPSIAINPKDPGNIVAGAILDKVYVSRDTGKTWIESRLKSSAGVFGDPCVVAGPKGDIYYLHLSDPSGKGWSDPSLLDRIVCQRSKDGGKTWNDGGFMGLNGNRDQDKEWAAVDPRNGRIHATWTEFQKYGSRSDQDSTFIMYSSSNRKATRWKKAVRINQFAGNCIDSDGTVEGAVPAVGPSGEVYVSWALDEKIWFDRSLDGGATWMDNDIEAALIPGGWDIDIPGIGRANGMPVTRVDLSESPNTGTIYINWCDQRFGKEDTDVWIIRSKDKGATWSEPLRVNDDLPGKHQFFTWMDVDPVTGYIYIVFYDRRNHKGNETDVYMAVSKDGGNSFENMEVSRYAFTPSERVFFGDYNNISAYDGIVRPIWTHFENGKLSIRTALVEY